MCVCVCVCVYLYICIYVYLHITCILLVCILIYRGILYVDGWCASFKITSIFFKTLITLL